MFDLRLFALIITNGAEIIVPPHEKYYACITGASRGEGSIENELVFDQDDFIQLRKLDGPSSTPPRAFDARNRQGSIRLKSPRPPPPGGVRMAGVPVPPPIAPAVQLPPPGKILTKSAPRYSLKKRSE